MTIWPVGFLLHIYTVIAGGEDRRFAVLSLAPLIYLGLLFAANAWLVR